MTRGDFTATAWRKAKTSLELYAMVFNVSMVACFALSGFVVFSSYAYMVTSLASLLSSSSPLTFFPSFTHSVMEQAKIFSVDLNTRNTTALQADCSLTYAGNNIYLPTSFC